MKYKLLALIILAGMLVLSACATTPTPAAPIQPTQPRDGSQSDTGLANPSAVFCGDKGFKYEIRTAADGSQGGACVFPDGSECDGWAFFRGECGPKPESTETACNTQDAGCIPPSVPPAPNKPVDAAKQYMAKELDLSADAIEVLSSEQVNWPDACLGLAAKDEMCAQVVTPGYRVVLKSGEKTATFHTNVLGDVIREETAGSQPAQ